MMRWMNLAREKERRVLEYSIITNICPTVHDGVLLLLLSGIL